MHTDETKRKMSASAKRRAPRTLAPGPVPAEGTPEHVAHRKMIYRRFRARSFGMTLEEFDEMFKAHSGLCDICGAPAKQGVGPKGRERFRLDIDHDHTTGEVRGLLCNNCNRGLGHFKDNPELLRIAISYIERSAKQGAA